MINHM